MSLNEQVAYKRGVAGPKKRRPELIIVKMAVYIAKAKVTLVFWTQALAMISKVFLKKKDIKTDRCMWLLWRHFCISRIQIDEAIASTTFVEAKKEALARRILQVR